MRLRPTLTESFVLLAITSIFVAFAYDEYEGYRGARNGLTDANVDLASGILRLKFGGKAQPWQANVVRLFRERYGIEISHIYGCCPSEYESHYARAYNDRLVRQVQENSPSFSANQVFDDAHEKWKASDSTRKSSDDADM